MNNESAELTTKFKLMFEPDSIVFLGATNDPRKWGFRILANIVNGGFKGKIYPVNPTKEEILGLKVYKNVTEVPETPDLAVIVIPPSGVPAVLKECATKGIKMALVITAGFAEVGTEGQRLQQEMVEIAASTGMRFMGPNSNGIVNPHHRFYPEMPPIFPRPGPISIVSQSGNIVGTIMRLAIDSGFGCAKCVSSGNEADLHSEDYVKYLAEDPQTKVILSYIEGFKNGNRFFEIAKEVSKKKPIVMIKAGETPAGAIAAKSHTASLAGSYTLFDAMCKQSGIIKVTSLDELVDTGIALMCNPLPKGKRVGIVTAGGGWGVLAADACARLGLDVVSLPPETIKELDSFMPAWWNRGNPVDLVAGIFGDAVIRCIEVVLRSPAVDGVIFLGLMPALPLEQFALAAEETERERLREVLVSGIVGIFDKLHELSDKYKKPIVVASEPMAFAANLTRKIVKTLADKNSVCYDLPHKAATAFANLVKYSEYLNQDNE